MKSIVIWIFVCVIYTFCDRLQINRKLSRNRRSEAGVYCGKQSGIKCCPGHDSSCRVGGCFCDEYCMTAKDCCPDYLHTCQSGPCNNYSTIQNEEKRSTGYLMDLNIDSPLSDNTLEESWYRVLSANGEEMPTNPPGPLHCGTQNPIWLNGSLPTFNNTNVTSNVCMETVSNVCHEFFNISIQHCGSFLVYKLRETMNNSAYCFGSGPVRCPNGLSSESGFYPECSDSFPHETIYPMVQSILIEGETYPIPTIEPSPSLIPVFRCKLEEVSNGMYVYDVYWYINGVNIIVFKNVPLIDFNTTDLTEEHWVETYRMNMQIKCAVRVRYEVNSLPSQFHESPIFHAGFYPEKYEYSVVEGEFINITFHSTVPVPCFSSNIAIRSQCAQNFYVFQPKYETNAAKCLNNLANRDVVFEAEFCGIKLESLYWKKERSLRVYGFSDGLYNHQDRSTYIRLSTIATSPVSRVWNNVQIPDIKVTVLDKDSVMTSRLCQSYNDPHITTFDGLQYHYMEVGEFVMYRNNRGPYWVHALFTNCGFGWTGSSCHCGIAIRSRRSLFVLRTCGKISRATKYLLDQPQMEVRTCDDSDLSVDANGNSYKITLPIGTEIRFTIDTYTKFLTMISIKPSIYDINEAKGLCGVPSTTRDSSDDYTHRELGPVSDERRFADSWRINSTMRDEQLFIAEPSFLTENITIPIVDMNNNSTVNTSRTQKRYCVCDQQAGPTDNLEQFYTVQCNLTESTEQCWTKSQSADDNRVSAIPTTCLPSFRQKGSTHRVVRRSISDSDDVVDVKTLEYDDDVTETEVVVPSFRNNWTEENANRTCFERLSRAIPTDLLNDMTGLSNMDYIASCILDIKLTADTQFLKDTVGAMQTFIVMEASRNETLAIQQTEDGSQTILEFITSLLCPNNCSRNGNCTLGTCLCYEGYVGDDCSRSISSAPSNISLPDNGLCEIRSRTCTRTNIYGTFLSTNVWCKRRHFQLFNGTKTYTSSAEVIKAEYRNVFMVSVDLKPSRRKRSTPYERMADGYEISLSNDNVSYGESTNIIIYDAECLTCNSTNLVCVNQGACRDLTTTTNKETVTDIKRTTSEEVVSFMVPTVVVGSIGLLLITGITIFVCRKSMLNRPKTDDQNRNIDGWNVYTGKPGSYANEAYSDMSSDLNRPQRYNTESTAPKRMILKRY